MSILNKLFSKKLKFFGAIIGGLIVWLMYFFNLEECMSIIGSEYGVIIRIINPLYWPIALFFRWIARSDLPSLAVFISWVLYGYLIGSILDYSNKRNKNIEKEKRAINFLVLLFVLMIMATSAIFFWGFFCFVFLDFFGYLLYSLIPIIITLIIGEKIFKDYDFNWVFKIITIMASFGFVYYCIFFITYKAIFQLVPLLVSLALIMLRRFFRKKKSENKEGYSSNYE